MRCLSVPQVARELGVTPQTVRAMIKRGELAAFKTHETGRLRVREDALLATVAAWEADLFGDDKPPEAA